jgi:hypothetical protein
VTPSRQVGQAPIGWPGGARQQERVHPPALGEIQGKRDLLLGPRLCLGPHGIGGSASSSGSNVRPTRGSRTPRQSLRSGAFPGRALERGNGRDPGQKRSEALVGRVRASIRRRKPDNVR